MNEKRRQIFNLGLVSLFNDLSSEVVTRVLPLYLIVVIRTSFFGIGVVEAIAESTATLGKLLSGFYSDRQGKRKPLIFAGYALSVISRPLILFQPTLVIASLSRFFDKIGKSIRTPPRDALIADLSSVDDRGRNFGVNRALDTLGAVIGLAVVFIYLHFTKGTDSASLKTILAWACGIGFATLVVLGLGVKEPQNEHVIQAKKMNLSFSGLDSRIRFYLIIGFFFALATSSDAFIIVRLKELGFSIGNIFLILTAFNVVSASTAFSLGQLSDRIGRKNLLLTGWGIYAASYFIFGFSHSIIIFSFTFLFYGLFYSLTDGTEKALIADFAEGDQKGQAYGWLGLVQGLAVIPANLVFASLYQKIGADWAFRSSAIFAVIGILLLSFFNPLREELPMNEEDDFDDNEIEDAEEESGPKGPFKNYITPSGLKKIKAEYHQLFHNERPKLVETISWAASNGDRSENGDYIYGKRRLREIDRRLKFLGRRLAAAVLVEVTPESKKAAKDTVLFGARVTVEDDGSKRMIYHIVGEDEIDVDKRKISWVSPIAKALINAKLGDSVVVNRPNGEMELTIVKIEYLNEE